jgi:hypothetical protein
VIGLLLVFVLLILVLVGVVALVSGAEQGAKRAYLLLVALGIPGLVCCVCLVALPLMTHPYAGALLTSPSSDRLSGRWVCAEGQPTCPNEVGVKVGDIKWELGGELSFAKGGRLSKGYRSMLIRDGTAASGNLVCEYDRLDEQRLRLDCGYGTAELEYQVGDETLKLWLEGQAIEYQRGE